MIQNKKILDKFNELKAAWNPADSESLFRLIDFENEIGASVERASVPTLSDLPNLNANEGRLVYVESENKHYYSDGFSWSDDLSTVPSDVTLNLSFGANTDGLLGLGVSGIDVPFSREPIPSLLDVNPSVISAGSYQTAVLSSGVIWGWGQNFGGNLGDGTNADRSSPVSVIGEITDWVDVRASGYWVMALRGDGTIWAWGSNRFGNLGDGTGGSGTRRSSPVSVIGGFTDWASIESSRYTAMAIRENGTLWAWGLNWSGGLGVGDGDYRSSPTEVLGGFTDWISIAPGYCSGGIRADGSLWTWGNNQSGERLHGDIATYTYSPVSITDASDWTSLYSDRFGWGGNLGDGWGFFFGIKNDGSVWGWGANKYGRLGDGTIEDRSSPVSVIGGITDWQKLSVGFYTVGAIRSDGSVWGWGSSYNNKPFFPESYGNIISIPTRISSWGELADISMGYSHGVAIKSATKGFDEFGS